MTAHAPTHWCKGGGLDFGSRDPQREISIQPLLLSSWVAPTHPGEAVVAPHQEPAISITFYKEEPVCISWIITLMEIPVILVARFYQRSVLINSGFSLPSNEPFVIQTFPLHSLFSGVTSNRTGGKGLKMFQGSLVWMLGKISPLQSLFKCWNRLSRVELPSLEGFERHVDVAWGYCLVVDLTVLD